jgi:hypothetical protein
MSRTHVFLRCMHPKLGGARKDIWDRPDEDGRMRKRPTSLGQLLGKSKWEKPLADWITATGVGFVGPDMLDKEEERIERNDGWRRGSLSFNCIFVFDLLCLLVGPHPPNGHNPPLREEDFLCVTCVVLSSFVYWLAFCVLDMSAFLCV